MKVAASRRGRVRFAPSLAGHVRAAGASTRPPLLFRLLPHFRCPNEFDKIGGTTYDKKNMTLTRQP
jgi:hypothetical protein